MSRHLAKHLMIMIGLLLVGMVLPGGPAWALQSPCLPGDVNGDCLVDWLDLQALAGDWLAAPACGPQVYCTDINDSGKVDTADFVALQGNWQQTPGPLPRIAAERNVPNPRFYVVGTGEEFIPIGANYIRLSKNQYNNQWMHITINTGFYDPCAIDEAFADVAAAGFNLLRVFLDRGDSWHQNQGQYSLAGLASTNTRTLYQPCVANFIDLLRRARKHGIYIMPVCNMWPNNKYYNNLTTQGLPTYIEGMNLRFLSFGGLEAKEQYMQELVRAVAQAEPGRALLSTVFAWQLTNELALHNDLKPFSLTAGKITTADGNLYDMGVAAERQQCMDANVNNFANQMTAAIKAIDPDAMVTIGMFTFDAVGKPGPAGLLPYDVADIRFPARPLSLMLYSDLSFVDVHLYPKNDADYSIDDDLNTSEYPNWDRTKMPVLLGEYGAHKQFWATEAAATAEMSNVLQTIVGQKNFKGALFWTWDCYEQETLWVLTEGQQSILAAIQQYFNLP